MAEWFKAAVLKTASRKGRGFESYPFRQLSKEVRSQESEFRRKDQVSNTRHRNLEPNLPKSGLNLIPLPATGEGKGEGGYGDRGTKLTCYLEVTVSEDLF